ncbi:hypothetical protein EIJ57_00600 [Xanthomonas perforans]|nr:hypothetical protein DB761_15220 [Xanthomonas perforans]RXD52237.1 hypothetical protein DB768_01385 [Xanthomonas perforans]RXD64871.1 hypothetical protein DB759_02135 [Xanthomonas perforans]RXD70996.1 hypothetical protein DB766_04740 [Xanthomonas perforans]RXD71832.1 hypothetical protein DB763_15930 [Xanthomonas perforans]
MTKAAVLPVVFDQASRALPAVLAAWRPGAWWVTGAARSTCGRNEGAMATHSRLPLRQSAHNVCTGASAGCVCMSIPIPPP